MDRLIRSGEHKTENRKRQPPKAKGQNRQLIRIPVILESVIAYYAPPAHLGLMAHGRFDNPIIAALAGVRDLFRKQSLSDRLLESDRADGLTCW